MIKNIKPLLVIFLLSHIGCKPTIDLKQLNNPVLFAGDERTAYRDPAVIFHEETFYLFFTLVEIEDDGKIYSYTAYSKSKDLLHWTIPVKITPKDQRLNYSSPGNIIRFENEWILCLQTYPRPGYSIADMPAYGDETARIFTMSSPDLEKWSAPKLLKVKGPDVLESDMGRMIDPYLIEDKDEKGKFWCFYKQNGVSMSWSYDLQNWTFYGSADAGENVCVLTKNDEYILFHSPSNGIGMKRSKNLKDWTNWDDLITLGQAEWEWAKGRITAGTVIDARTYNGVNKYLMFFHGSGPRNEKWDFDKNSSIGIAWSDDLLEWEWPGKK
ncbi:hypothetical protein QQ008_18665 [Fulvivirgaceae bacterium BMA10]|uniref:Family 43 glycosylhydrolase n=1 Tax=Splendidivirga corallicola TaxID=3051826 RepID=A0ABT8KTV6_9BACT|nr:hypothetical protein [Fulvivirgaceae bacterium BMA10]